MNANELNFTEPLQVRIFSEDTRPPVLVSFDLDLDSNLLLLTFNETIRVQTLNVTQLTVQDNSTVDANETFTFRTLEFGESQPNSSDDTVLVIELHP